MWVCIVKHFSVNVVANTLASSGTVLDVGLHSEAFLGERGCEHFGKGLRRCSKSTCTEEHFSERGCEHFGKGYEASLEVDLCVQLAGGGVCSRGGDGEQATLWQKV